MRMRNLVLSVLIYASAFSSENVKDRESPNGFLMEEATGQEQLQMDASFSLNTDGDVSETFLQAETKDSESTEVVEQSFVVHMSGDHQTSQSPELETNSDTKLLENISGKDASSVLLTSTISDNMTREYGCQVVSNRTVSDLGLALNESLNLDSVSVTDDNGTTSPSTQSDNTIDDAPLEHSDQSCNSELNTKTHQSHDVVADTSCENEDIELYIKTVKNKLLQPGNMNAAEQDPCNVIEMEENTNDQMDRSPNQSITEENHEYVTDDGDIFPKFLLCQKCTRPMNQPRILPCLHMFCGICISSPDCPECGEVIAHHVPDSPNKFGFQNVFIENMIALELDKRADDVRCGICSMKQMTKLDNDELDGVSASFKCIDCGDFLCCTCADKHTFSSLTINHQVVDLNKLHTGEYDAQICNLRQVKCEAHPLEAVEFYCTECRQVACRNCCLTVHSTHRLMNQHDAMETYRAELVSLQEELVDKMGKIDTDRHEQIMAELKIAENTEIDKLELVVKNLNRKIEKEKKHVLKNLRKTFTTNQCMYTKKKEETDNFITAVNIALQVTDKLIENGSSAEIMSIFDVIENRMKKLINTDTREEFLKYQYLPQVFTEDVCTNKQKLGLFHLKFQFYDHKDTKAIEDDFVSTECGNEESEHFPYKINRRPNVPMDSNNGRIDNKCEITTNLTTKELKTPQSFEQQYKLELTNSNPVVDRHSHRSSHCLPQQTDLTELHNPEKATEFYYTMTDAGSAGDSQLPITISLMYKVDIKCHLPNECKKMPKLIAVSTFPKGVGVYDAANNYVIIFTHSDKLALPCVSKGTNMAMGSTYHAISSLTTLDVYDRSGTIIKSMKIGNPSAFGHPLAATETRVIIGNYKYPSVRSYSLKLRKMESFHLDQDVMDLSIMKREIISKETPPPQQYVFLTSRGRVLSMDKHGIKDCYPPEGEYKDWAPVSVSVDHHGHIFVVDVKMHTLVMLDRHCHFLEEWMLPEVHQPSAVACGNDECVYVISKTSQFVFVFNVNCDNLEKN